MSIDTIGSAVILPLVAGALLLIYLATKVRRRTLLLTLSAVIVFLVLYRAAREVGPSIVAPEVVSAELATADEQSRAAPSTSEMWDELYRNYTQPKIDLNDGSEAESAENSKQIDSDDPSVEESQPRPDWVETPPNRVGDVYRRRVASGPHATIEDCHQELETELRKAVNDRITELSSESFSIGDAGLPSLDRAGIGIDYILRDICREEFVETSSRDYADMKTVYVLMEFDPAVDRRLLNASRDYVQRTRVQNVAKGAVAVISVLALIYGLLTFDTWTRGYYTKRLLLGTSAAIIIVALLSYA